MMRLGGKSVQNGIALGPVIVLKRQTEPVRREKVSDVEAELEAVRTAAVRAGEELWELYDKALREVGESGGLQK